MGICSNSTHLITFCFQSTRIIFQKDSIFGVNFGPAFSRFAIYFYFDVTTWDPDKAESYDRYDLVVGLNPRFWFGDHVSMDIDLFGKVWEYDYPTDTGIDDLTYGSFNFDIALKVRF